MLSSHQSDQLEPHNSLLGSVNDPIQSNPDAQGWLISIPAGNSTNRKKPRSDDSEGVSPRKHSRMHECDDENDGQTLVNLPGAETDTRSTKDTEMDTLRQQMNKVKQQMNSLNEQVELLKQHMEILEQKIYHHHTSQTCGVIEKGHLTTPQSILQQDTMGNHFPSHLAPSPFVALGVLGISADTTTVSDSTTITTATRTSSMNVDVVPRFVPVRGNHDDDDDDDDGDDNTVDATSTSSLPPDVVTRHGARQFTSITPLITPAITTLSTIPPTIKPPKKYYPHSRMDVHGKYAIVPSMMLCVLANNPDIMLPLASFQTCLFDHMHVLNQESFHLSCKPMSYFDSITKVINSVVSNRIRSALNTLYPQAGLDEDDSNDDELKAMALELEKGPVDVLESIVRDAMAVWSPIRVLITHLEAVTMHYSKCTTDEREALRQHIATGHGWMRHTANMALVYGLYMWDSQWVSDDEWDTLVKHMTTLTTQIFPEAYKSLLKMNSGPRSTLTNDDRAIIDYFRYILGIVSCCFLHQYRPVQRPISIPHCSLINTDTHWYTIPKSVYETALTSSITMLKQCVSEYMDSPPAFPQFSSMENLLLHSTTDSTTTTDDYASPRDYIMSKIELACNSHATRLSSTHKSRDGRTLVCWNSRVPMYYGDYIIDTFHLTNRIIHAPPHNDPVYRRISTIYPSQFHRSSLLGDYYYPDDGPRFQKMPAPVNRARDNSNPRRPSVQDVYVQSPSYALKIA